MWQSGISYKGRTPSEVGASFPRCCPSWCPPSSPASSPPSAPALHARILARASPGAVESDQPSPKLNVDVEEGGTQGGGGTSHRARTFWEAKLPLPEGEEGGGDTCHVQGGRRGVQLAWSRCDPHSHDRAAGKRVAAQLVPSGSHTLSREGPSNIKTRCRPGSSSRRGATHIHKEGQAILKRAVAQALMRPSGSDTHSRGRAKHF